MDDEQLMRYSRQIMLPEVDVAGQEKLCAARVLIVGMGGLGSPLAMYLAAAGVGKLILADDDAVDLSNLQRQIVHTQASLGLPKVKSAQHTLNALNPECYLETIEARLDATALENLLDGVDLVCDASDNFDVRFAINDTCWKAGVPLVSGAAIRWEGQVTVFDPRDADSPCYRCLYLDGDDQALNCSENGVIAPLVGVIGTMQAMEAIKLITGVGESLAGALLYYDAKYADWRKLRLPKRQDCPICSG
ncbi:MAG: molybdopterin-synthase adenylyltransferase MoeB [Pseudomonadales bacterium]|jgi:adenylyltransferase/sulfurtransferase|nr:molybdopterin-synthase adenylyltransferase MoeB [Pseudomonadales bacterium]MDP6472650.1 molybdopterin-synthase adenylyltransferase MoeB [Pseudomonadales bacterium]MDP6829072.1 molybdopterin-synthase adenylyltransferase MoeB [Pseudomonadales bacterium]MDP6971384.1 molybdopterin-synthase adenylyltransferase MoeB [Pseudomonadales bacterium]|tara:strand:- start:132 stop:875 length:744 start_codon:yes stop_codon:yes gene_type:complete